MLLRTPKCFYLFLMTKACNANLRHLMHSQVAKKATGPSNVLDTLACMQLHPSPWQLRTSMASTFAGLTPYFSRPHVPYFTPATRVCMLTLPSGSMQTSAALAEPTSQYYLSPGSTIAVILDCEATNLTNYFQYGNHTRGCHMALTMQDGKHVTLTPLPALLTTNAPKMIYDFDGLVYSFMVMHATVSLLIAASCLLAPHNSVAPLLGCLIVQQWV